MEKSWNVVRFQTRGGDWIGVDEVEPGDGKFTYEQAQDVCDTMSDELQLPEYDGSEPGVIVEVYSY